MIRKLVWVFILLVVISGCSPTGMPAEPLDLPLPTLPITSAGAQPTDTEVPPTETIAPTPIPQLEQTQYILNVELAYEQHQVSVQEKILYSYKGNDPVRHLELWLEPHRIADQFEMTRFQAQAPSGKVDAYALDNGHLTVTLPEALQTGDLVEIDMAFTYELTPYAWLLGYSERQTVLMYWYAQVLPYVDGEGWMQNPPSMVGEFLALDPADHTVTIHVDDEETLVVGPAMPLEVDRGVYHFEVTDFRTFMWTASPDLVPVPGDDDEKVVAYVFPEHMRGGEAAKQASEQALALYSDLFGQYPYEHLMVVEFEYYDGMESDGMYFLGMDYFANYDGTPKNYLTTIAAHETAHQWWYSLVGNDPANDPWLDETLATYCELLYYEHTYPSLVEWWWGFRLFTTRSIYPLNSSVYLFDDFYVYVNAVYLNGVLFMDDLRDTMGDEAFFAALREYARQGAGKWNTTGDLLGFFTDHSENSLGEIFSSYLRRDW